MSDNLKALAESIRVNPDLPPDTIVMVSSELGRALALHYLNGGSPDQLPPGWDAEMVTAHITVIRNVGIEQDENADDL